MRDPDTKQLDPEPARRGVELPAGLTERELEVLLVLVLVESSQEIADRLGISVKTVGHHVQHVYEKAGVRGRAAATFWAFEHDLVRTRGGVALGGAGALVGARAPPLAG